MFSDEKLDILLPEYKDAIKRVEDSSKGVNNGFVQGEWWKK